MRIIFIIFTFSIAVTFKTAFGQIKGNWEFKDELISYLQSPKDTIYIEARKKLHRIGGLKCNDSTVTFNDTVNPESKLLISIKNQVFDRSKHKIYLSDTGFIFIHNEKRIDHLIYKNLIDGKPAYGNFGDYPHFEIERMKIRWNNTWLKIPDSAFHNLYETHLCIDYLPIEAYITKNNKLLYIYIAASDGAGSYSVKLVFNRNKYLARIVNRNQCTTGYDFLDGIGSCATPTDEK